MIKWTSLLDSSRKIQIPSKFLLTSETVRYFLFYEAIECRMIKINVIENKLQKVKNNLNLVQIKYIELETGQNLIDSGRNRNLKWQTCDAMREKYLRGINRGKKSDFLPITHQIFRKERGKKKQKARVSSSLLLAIQGQLLVEILRAKNQSASTR